MKETFEKIILFIILTSIIIGLLNLIAKSNQKVKDNAIARCGSESNLVEHIDNDGTTWYSCKVDK
jgi:hypothetical protein